MTYTKEAKQALSRKVAEKYGLANYLHRIYPNGSNNHLWLHDDWHAIMELCVNHGVNAGHYVEELSWFKSDFVLGKVKHIGTKVYVHDCASPSEAERIARLLALLEA